MLTQNVRHEFERSPVTVTCTVLGIIIALCSLLLAWSQSLGSLVPIPPSGEAFSASTGLRVPNLLLVFSVFLASSLSGASLIRLLDQRFPFSAPILSIPTAVASGFITLLAVRLSPPRPLTVQLFGEVKTAVFWGTLFVFVAFNAYTVLRVWPGLRRPSGDGFASGELPSETKTQDNTFFVGVLALLVIWALLFYAGLSKLTSLFLS